MGNKQAGKSKRLWWLLCDRDVRNAVRNLLQVASRAREGHEAEIVTQCATFIEMHADTWADGKQDPTEKSADMSEYWALVDVIRGKEG